MQEPYFENTQRIIVYLEEKLKDNPINYVKLFENLKNNFRRAEFALCLSYIIQNKQDTKLLEHAIRQIHKTRWRRNLPCLIDFILRPYNNSDFLNLKVLAIKTISNYKDTSSVSALLYCLNNKESNYKIRLAAAEALGRIGDKNAFETLTNVICDDSEKSTYVKESAVAALGMLGDNRALDVFGSIINTKQMFLDKFSYLKERIVEAMGKFEISRDIRALNILKSSLLDNSSSVRIAAIETLMDSDFDCAYDLIYERLRFDDDIEVRKNALAALYNISDRKILDEVISGVFPIELKQYAQEIISEYENE